MNYSKSGLQLTERFEDCKLVAYMIRSACGQSAMATPATFTRG
jgi:hypothetical protein